MLLDGGVGFKIPAGSVLALQIHYVTTGHEGDRPDFGGPGLCQGTDPEGAAALSGREPPLRDSARRRRIIR